MLNFNNFSIRRGHHLLFAGANFTIHKKQKVGVTGANGVGKSSLFACIRMQLQPDEGNLTMPPGLEIAHVAQESPSVNRVALEFVIDGDRELRKLQARLVTAEQKDDGVEQADMHARLEDIHGYTAPARASRLLSGLGFSINQHHYLVGEFSGGWRMRLNLAQALMCRSDVLLLDEPTNHLDLDAVIWLQDWLEKYPGTLLLISHDRDFLDGICTQILHIEQHKAEIYSGNYSAFERLRAEKLAQQQTAYEKQQREVAHMRSFVERFRAKATKARQAQSRIKSLEKMTLISQAHVDSPFDFRFPNPEKLPDPLLRLQQISIAYADTEVLTAVDFTISPGERIALLGPNGAGKSSLIKCIAGALAPTDGTRHDAETLNIGYFAQHQLEQLRAEQSPLWHCRRLDPRATEKELRNFLGGFNFRNDQVNDPIELFSGGEKARLVLALLVYQNPNLLLLDEPSNHLDLEMRHALAVALQEYHGAVVLVSHDRHLLRSVCDQLLLVANSRVQPYDGDLDDYRLWLTEQKNAANDTVNTPGSAVSKKKQRRLEAQQRQKLKPLSDALTKIEATVKQLHEQQQLLETQLAAPELYAVTEKTQLKRVLQQKFDVDQALENAESDWLEASENFEAARQLNRA